MASALEARRPEALHSAVGRDGTGAILFILCREPITGVDFGALLLALPIDVRVVMYTEGGSLAGLFLRTPVRSQIWLGRSLPELGLPEARGLRCPTSSVSGANRNVPSLVREGGLLVPYRQQRV